MLENPFLCEFCVADNELRWELEERGTLVQMCPICHHKGGKALSATDPRLKRTFRALIRLNFSEWDYNSHIGADKSLQRLVFDCKSIFHLDESAWGDEFEAAYLSMEEKSWYPDLEEDISLGGGYWDGCVLEGLRDRRDRTVEDVVSGALKRNWFEMEPSARALVQSLRGDLSHVVPTGAEYFRARIGVQSRLKRKRTSREGQEFRYLPHTGKDIDRPPLAVVTEGRFNRARVSILYLASDTSTAVAELRPHPGHLVSTAKFRLTRDLRVANFAMHDIRNFLSDSRLEDLRRILSMADVLNVPVQPEHRSLYAVTQLFSDAVRAEGFDGLTFRSSVGCGTNLTCFVSDAFEMVVGSEGVQEVVSLQYRMTELSVLSQDYDREVFLKDEDSPLATLLHGMARQGSEK